jgi:hypothetical protein
MRAIGFFRQLRHGLPKGPDIHEALRVPLAPEERGPLAAYLRACPVFAATGSRGDDVLDPTRRQVSRIDTHTDGAYVWPEDLAYYVEVYGVRPPLAFIEHVSRARGIPAFEPGAMQRLEPIILEAVAAQR